MHKAAALTPGDTIALIAPASAPQVKDKITKSVEYFEKLGYRVTIGKHVGRQYGYLAGSDAMRADDIHYAVRDKKVKAIFMLRGGYGTIRLLPYLDYDLIKRNPKIFVGYSDATALFNALFHKAHLHSCFYGPMPGVDIWNGFNKFAEENFWKALTSTEPLGELPSARGEIHFLYGKKRDVVEGRLLGGNLTVFSSIWGTPYVPSLKDSILFFEDVNEKPYRLDRYLAQLKISGALDHVKAILLGQYSDCVDTDPTLTTTEVFRDYFSKLGVPVLTNLPSGHIPRQWTLPYGAQYRVQGTKIAVIESVLT